VSTDGLLTLASVGNCGSADLVVRYERWSSVAGASASIGLAAASASKQRCAGRWRPGRRVCELLSTERLSARRGCLAEELQRQIAERLPSTGA
jgi:hypothetical protein